MGARVAGSTAETRFGGAIGIRREVYIIFVIGSVVKPPEASI
jgi:hypothetical protein